MSTTRFLLLFVFLGAVIFTGVTAHAQDPRIVAWGQNTQGQTDVPEGLEDAVQVEGGFFHSLALRANGTVVAWGNNSAGQTDVPEGLNDAVQVAAGVAHSLALRADGTVVAWGNNSNGETDVPAGLNNVVQVAASAVSAHSLALRADGTVVAWGTNGSGETNVPAGLNDIVQVAAGGEYSLALRADGTVVAWGNNNSGQTDVPAGLNDVVQLAAGGYHSVALRANGTVVAWGDNSMDQTDVPAGLTDVVQVAAGEISALALLADGSVIAWGSNIGGATDVPEGLPDTYKVAGGPRFYLALVRLPDEASQFLHVQVEAEQTEIPANGTATFSFNFQDGDGTAVNNVPVLVRVYSDEGLIHQETTAGISNGGTWAFDVPTDIEEGDLHFYFRAVHEAYPHSPARLATIHVAGPPRIVGWGRNDDGQLNIPAGLEDAVQIAAGTEFAVALMDNGTVIAWGQNDQGQTNVPAGLNDVVHVATGAGHTLALRADGTIVAWGINFWGQIVVPEGLNDVVQVAAGGHSSFALKSDGSVVAWGHNNQGQTDIPAGLSDVVHVAAGGAHVLALRADGTVVAWGNNQNGQTNVPSGLSDVVQLTGGSFHSLALRADGTVVAWGSNSTGQSNVPAGLTDVVQVDGGNLHSLALRADGSVVAWGYNLNGQIDVPEWLPDTWQIIGGVHFTLALVRMPDEASQFLHVQVEAQQTDIPPGGTATFAFNFQDGDGEVVNNVPVRARVFHDGELIHEETTAGISNDGTWDFNVPAEITGGVHGYFKAVHTAYPHAPARMATVQVQDINNPPEFTSEPVTEAHENEVYLYEITASDPDGDDLTITTSVLPEWLTLTDHENGTATLTGTPLEAHVGANPVTLVVSDGESTAQQVFNIQVIAINVNNPPVFTSAPVTEVHENEIYLYEITTSDPDGDDLTITASVLPEWLTLTDHENGTATLTGTPLEAHVGANPVTLVVSDGESTAQQVFNIQVIAEDGNNPPTPAVITSPEDGEEITVTDSPTATVLVEWTVSEDPDGDEVSYLWQADFNEDFSDPVFAIATSETTLEIPMPDLLQAMIDHGLTPGQSAPLYHRVLSSDDEDTSVGPTASMVLVYTVSNEDGTPAGIFTVHGLYPNPTSGPTTLVYDLPEAADVRIDIYDLLGRLVDQIDAGLVAAGAGRTITIPGGMLSAGTYVYRLVAHGTMQPETATGRFTIVR